MADNVCGTGLWGNPTKPGDPDNNVVLTAVPAFGGIDVEWTYPNVNPEGVAHVNLYRSTSPDVATAIRHKVVHGNFFYDRIENQHTTYYYWIEIVSVNKTVGDKIGPASANARPLIEDVIELLTGKIDSGVLAENLRSEIARLGPLEDMITTEVGDRVASLDALTDVISGIQNAVDAQLDSFNERLLEQLEADAELVDELNSARGDLASEAARLDQRIAGVLDTISDIQGTLQSEAARLDGRVDAVSEAVTGARTALEAADDALDQRLQDAETNIVNQAEVHASDQAEVVETLEGIQADVGENRAYIAEMQRVSAEKDLVEAIQFEAIRVEAAHRLAAMRTQDLVRIDAEAALSQRITDQNARFDDNEASITQVSTALSDAQSSLASQIGELSAKLDAAPTFGSGFEAGADFDQWHVGTGHGLTADTSGPYAGTQSGLLTSTQHTLSVADTPNLVYANVPSGATQAFEGYEVVVKVAARQPDTNASDNFAVAYGTASAGHSGWQYFTPTSTWQEFEFRYQVPEGSTGSLDYLALWADTDGDGKGLLVDSVSIKRASAEIAEISAAITEANEARVVLGEALASDIEALEAEVSGNLAAFQAEQTANADEHSALTSSLETLRSRTDDAEADITQLSTTQTNQYQSLAQRATGLETRLDQANAAITQLQQTSSEDGEAMASDIQALQSRLDDAESDIAQEALTRATDDEALSSTLEGLSSRVGEAEGAITSEAQTRADETSALAQRTSNLESDMETANSRITTVDETLTSAVDAVAGRTSTLESSLEDAEAAITTIEEAYVAGDQANAQRITGLASDLQDAEASFTSSIETLAREDEAQAMQLETLRAGVEDANALITSNQDLLAEKTMIEGIQFQAIEASKAGNRALIALEEQVRVTETSALAQRTSQLETSMEDAEASITRIDTAYVEADQALAQQQQSTQAALDEAKAQFTSDIEALVDEDAAQASTTEGLLSRMDDAESALVTEQQTRASEVEALASQDTALGTRLDDAEAGLRTTSETVSDLESAQAIAFSGLDARLEDAEARILEEQRVTAEQDLLEAIQFSGMEANRAGNRAVIAVERQTRASESEAFSSQITQIQSQVGDSLAAVIEEMETQIETVNGEVTKIGALYTAKVTADGLIGGFGVYNDGSEVEAGFDVDRFWVGRTNSNKRKPFIIEGDEVFIDEAAINKLTFSKLRDEAGTLIVEDGKLQADYISVGDLVVRQGKSDNYVPGKTGWIFTPTGGEINSDFAFRGTVEFSQINGAGALATKNSLSYYDLTGTKPPADADKTSSNKAYDTSRVAGTWASTIRDRANNGNSAKSRVDDWTRPGSTRINGNRIYTGDAYVDTLQIRGQAVTVPVSATKTSTIYNKGKWVDTLTIKINPEGGRAIAWFSASVQGYSGTYWRWKLNGSVKHEMPGNNPSIQGIIDGGSRNGTITITVQSKRNYGNTGVYYCTLVGMGAKR